MFELCSVTKRICIAMCMLWSVWDVGNSKQAGIEVSSRLISSLCGLYTKFQDEKIMAEEPLKSVPQGLPLLDTACDTWKRTCGEDCKTWKFKKESKCKYKKERGARIIGGEDAKLGDAPWDLHMRMIYDWGGTQGSPGKFTAEEKATNNVSRIKETFRFTGIFYTKNVVVTTALCGRIGQAFALTRNRFVGWLARERFLLQNWCVLKSDVNPKDTCDINIHPNYSNPRNFSNPRNRDEIVRLRHSMFEHDISVINFRTAFDFKKLRHTKAILFAPPGMEFEGKAIFAGWGITDDSYTDQSIIFGHPSRRWPAQPTKLQKIELTIIPFEPKCKALLRSLFENSTDPEDVFDPNYDYSQRYICAEPADGTKQGLCYGDAGGALVCDKDEKKYVCGMRNDWGATWNCLEYKDKNGTEIFMKMSYYTPWIESVAGKQSDSDLNP